MGNSGLRKIFFPGDLCETKYSSAYDMNVIDLDKNEVPLSKFRNKVSLFVNVASFNTSAQEEIKKLKELQAKFTSDNFEVLAFPCNQFSNEPGNYQDIKKCYHEVHHVNFPVFAKVEVNGEFTSPVFKYLRRNSSLFNLALINVKKVPGDFTKFLVDQEGNVINYYTAKSDINKLAADIEKVILKLNPKPSDKDT